MALRELVTQLRYELKDGNLKKYVDGYRNAEKQINTVAKLPRGSTALCGNPPEAWAR